MEYLKTIKHETVSILKMLGGILRDLPRGRRKRLTYIAKRKKFLGLNMKKNTYKWGVKENWEE